MCGRGVGYVCASFAKLSSNNEPNASIIQRIKTTEAINVVNSTEMQIFNKNDNKKIQLIQVD